MLNVFCILLETGQRNGFLGMIFGVAFLRKDELCTVGYLCARMCNSVYGVIAVYLRCVYRSRWEFCALGNRLCFDRGGTFANNAEESAASILTPLQNDSAGKCVDS